MNIPDFSVFLASIDQDDLARELDAMFYGTPSVIQFSADDPALLERAMNLRLEESERRLTASFTLLLRRYHAWLQDQLETDTL